MTGQIVPGSHGDVIYMMPAESIRHLPVVNVEILLTAADGGKERTVGRYTLVRGGSLHR